MLTVTGRLILVLMVLTIGPTSPMGPGLPWAPFSPADPCSPLAPSRPGKPRCPLIPGSPGIPGSPLGPGGPWDPGCPDSPSSPVSPWGAYSNDKIRTQKRCCKIFLCSTWNYFRFLGVLSGYYRKQRQGRQIYSINSRTWQYSFLFFIYSYIQSI